MPYERFDVGLTTISGINGDISASGEVQYPTPQIASNATGLYYVRNRWLSPSTGRWLTRDPNANGQSVLGLAQHASPLRAKVENSNLLLSVTDGSGVYEYVGGDSVNRADPQGLFFSFVGTLMTMQDMWDMASENLEQAYMGVSMGLNVKAMGDGYAVDQIFDVDWASDWSQADDEYSRAGNWGRGGYMQTLDRQERVAKYEEAWRRGENAEMAMARRYDPNALVSHHIMTNKHRRFTTDFKVLMAKTGMTPQDIQNFLDNHKSNRATISGHTHGRGRHKHAYHQNMLNELTEAVGNKTGIDALNAIDAKLEAIRKRLETPGNTEIINPRRGP